MSSWFSSKNKNKENDKNKEEEEKNKNKNGEKDQNKEEEKDQQPGSSNTQSPKAEKEPNPPENPETASKPSRPSLLSSIHKNAFTLENKKKFLKKLMEIAKEVLREQLEEGQLRQAKKFEIAVVVLSEKLCEAAEEIHKMDNQK